VLCRKAVIGKRGFALLLTTIVSGARQRGFVQRRPEAAIDATGLETRHTSRYYVFRAGYKPFQRTDFAKLTVVCHTRSHLFVAAVVTRGPSQDSPQFGEAMIQAAGQIRWHRLLADAGYDGEHNHRLCREQLGIPSTIIALNRRNTGRRWPKGRYRREMKHPANRHHLAQRWQVESAFSRNKRLLGSALHARNEQSQQRECYLRVLTHNLMLLA
jgi:hypothetical protein